MIRFIDEHKDRRSGKLRWGIEPIAQVLGIAPSTYHAAKKRPPSARALREAALKPLILRVWEQNLAVYGADKVWDQLNKDGVTVARCTVERLMADMGLQGCRRGRVFVRTTEGDDRLERPADLVERQFRAPAPNRLWVADLTYVKTHSGWVYMAFILVVFSRMIVGWPAARSLRSALAIDALEMAVLNRRRAGADLSQLTHHSDRGVQYLSVRYSQRLADNAIVASVGSKGDSYDCDDQSRSTGSTSGSSSTRRVRGAASTTSSSPPSNTSTGSTTVASTARSNPAPASPPPRRSRPPTTVNRTQPPRPRLKPPSLYETRGGSSHRFLEPLCRAGWTPYTLRPCSDPKRHKSLPPRHTGEDQGGAKSDRREHLQVGPNLAVVLSEDVDLRPDIPTCRVIERRLYVPEHVDDGLEFAEKVEHLPVESASMWS